MLFRSVPRLHGALAVAESMGLEIAQRANAGQTIFLFIDDVARHGHYWELYESSPGLLAFYEMVRNAHETWDGSDPVRDITKR